MINNLSIIVNWRCDLRCEHCGYARYRRPRHPHDLTHVEWAEVVTRACQDLNGLSTISVGAMEPLLPKDWAKTVAILEAGITQKRRCGFVTHGLHAEAWSQKYPDLRCDYIDVSLDGPPDIDAKVRGGTIRR